MAINFPTPTVLNEEFIDPSSTVWVATNITTGRVTWERKGFDIYAQGLDGGSSASVYTNSQLIDGGSA